MWQQPWKLVVDSSGEGSRQGRGGGVWGWVCIREQQKQLKVGLQRLWKALNTTKHALLICL